LEDKKKKKSNLSTTKNKTKQSQAKKSEGNRTCWKHFERKQSAQRGENAASFASGWGSVWKEKDKQKQKKQKPNELRCFPPHFISFAFSFARTEQLPSPPFFLLQRFLQLLKKIAAFFVNGMDSKHDSIPVTKLFNYGRFEPGFTWKHVLLILYFPFGVCLALIRLVIFVFVCTPVFGLSMRLGFQRPALSILPPLVGATYRFVSPKSQGSKRVSGQTTAKVIVCKCVSKPKFFLFCIVQFFFF
jgi:hypothetical protein